MRQNKSISQKTFNIKLDSNLAVVQAFAQLNATIIDLEELLAMGLDIINQSFPFDLLAVMHVSEKSGKLTLISYLSEKPNTILEIFKPFTTEVLNSGLAIEQKQISEDGLNYSCLIVPVATGRLVTGVFIIANFHLYSFKPSERELFTIFAEQIMVATTVSKLYIRKQQQQQQEITRRQIATHFQKISSIINSTLNLNDVLRLLLEHLRVIVPYSSALVMLVKGSGLVIQAVAGFDNSLKGEQINVDENVILKEVLLQKYPAVFSDMTKNQFWMADSPKFLSEVRAWIGAPIVVKSKIMGIFTLHHDKPGYFDGADLELIYTFANQAAIGIENALLYQREQNKVKQFQIIARIGRQATSIYEVQPLLDMVAQQLHRRLDYEFISIFLYRSQTNSLHLKAASDLSAHEIQELNLTFPLTKPTLVTAVANKQSALLVHDVTSFEPYIPHPIRKRIQSEFSIPLVIKGNLIGVFDVQSVYKHTFSPDDVMLVQTVADQIAVAIETASLFEQRNKRMVELSVFNQIGTDIADMYDLDNVLISILERIKMLYQVEGASLLVLRDGLLHFEIALGMSGQVIRPFTLKANEGFAGWVIQHKRPLRVSNAAEDKRHHKGIDKAINFTTHTLLAVPVQIQGQILGVVEIMNRIDGNHFTQEDEIVLSFIASTIAVTLENARLFKKLTNSTLNEQSACL